LYWISKAFNDPYNTTAGAEWGVRIRSTRGIGQDYEDAKKEYYAELKRLHDNKKAELPDFEVRADTMRDEWGIAFKTIHDLGQLYIAV
jgi:hypothetical protein